MQERRKQPRLKISYYMPLREADTQRIIGHLLNINAIGLMIDAQQEVPVGRNILLRLDTDTIADKSHIEFVGLTRWCRNDPIEPFLYNVGFELKQISPEDSEIFKRVIDLYTTPETPEFKL